MVSAGIRHAPLEGDWHTELSPLRHAGEGAVPLSQSLAAVRVRKHSNLIGISSRERGSQHSAAWGWVALAQRGLRARHQQPPLPLVSWPLTNLNQV